MMAVGLLGLPTQGLKEQITGKTWGSANATGVDVNTQPLSALRVPQPQIQSAKDENIQNIPRPLRGRHRLHPVSVS